MAKEIILKKLHLKNFKGIKELQIDFNSKVTNIYGDNATGKTTIFDAFTWLLFDKDSQDRAAFEIKTLNESGEVIHGLEHEVTGEIYVNGKKSILTKVFKEKWTKKKGEAERTLTGHETLYYIDEVPVKQSEYKDFVNSLINENIFKLITNPLYFSLNMKWQDRRNIIIDIVGDISVDSVINYKSDLKAIEEFLIDKDIDTLKKSIAARKKRLNEDIKAIPYRIDELNKSKQELDFETLEFQKRGIIAAIKTVEEKLMDNSKVNEELLKEKENLYKLKSKKVDIEHKADEEKYKPLQDAKYRLNQINRDLIAANQNLSIEQNMHDNCLNLIEQIKKDIESLRLKWYEANNQELIFDENEFICPVCKRPFEADDIEAKRKNMQDNFNLNKSKLLSQINADGIALKEKLKKYETDLQIFKEHIFSITIEIENLNSKKKDLELFINNFIPTDTLSDNFEYQELKKQINEIEIKLSKPQQQEIEASNLKLKKSQLEKELEEVNKKLAYKEQNERLSVRIKELMDEEKLLAQQIANIEKQEYLCEVFIKAKVELLENSINSKFKYVNFKLFNTLVNGSIEECCEALINGVPFSSANTASQINAGLDIINALSKYYQVAAPIFIDNRESVNNLIETDSQVINLIVSKDKTLRIEGEVM